MSPPRARENKASAEKQNNAMQAAIRAGYSQKRASEIGYQLLQKTTVQKCIEDAQEKRSERTEITQDIVLKIAARLGRD